MLICARVFALAFGCTCAYVQVYACARDPVRVAVTLCACACVRVRVLVCVCVCVHAGLRLLLSACAHLRLFVFALGSGNFHREKTTQKPWKVGIILGR